MKKEELRKQLIHFATHQLLLSIKGLTPEEDVDRYLKHCEFIEQQEEVETTKEDEWISVENRLPVNTKEVWLYINGDVTKGYYSPTYKQWISIIGNNIPKPTHWREIIKPQPPKTK